MKKPLHWLPIALLALWAIPLLSLMALHVSSNGLLYWFVFGSAMLAGVGFMFWWGIDSYKESSRFRAWEQKLKALVESLDVPDDGHLFEAFDSAEWSKVLAELEQMPPGARSLRAAILKVDPKFFDADV
jgi:hypothetical protein